LTNLISKKIFKTSISNPSALRLLQLAMLNIRDSAAVYCAEKYALPLTFDLLGCIFEGAIKEV